MSSFLEKYWLIIAAVLVVSLITGIVFLIVRLSQLQPIEISLQDSPVLASSGEIYVGGAVARPGIYPVKGDDTLSSIIESAGVAANADLEKIKIYVPLKDQLVQPQKVNINRAEAWLLRALPNIGEGKATAIIDYRNKNGPFRNIDDLLKIEGFGSSIMEKIRGYVCVED
ncbi:MAG: ComEA family DNA-binding protein [Dehalococcoidia bacterium]|nr:ComEA family DNA-binding protein [Dehalococcoidia bacterium]MDD5493882.1 ComEA family DNA-binding protein [Dehalococcoidia bacterium]